MTPEQLSYIQAAKLELIHHALLYCIKTIEGYDTAPAEQRFLTAAKHFTRTIDAIDPKLWEPCSAWIEAPSTTQ